MKKFNTDHIRRRMRDQKGLGGFGSKTLNSAKPPKDDNNRIGGPDYDNNTEGRKVLGASTNEKPLISSPPIRVPIPTTVVATENNNENEVNQPMPKPMVSSMDKENVGVPGVKISIARPPQLSVAVTMDEDDEEGPDEIEAARSVTSSTTSIRNKRSNGINSNGSDNDLTQQNQSGEVSSVWAMMEHYQDNDSGQRRHSVSEEHSSSDGLPLEDDGMSLPTFSVSETMMERSVRTDGGHSIVGGEQSSSWANVNGGGVTNVREPQLLATSPKMTSPNRGQATKTPINDHKHYIQSDTKDARKISWNLDSNGSLIQTSMYSFEGSYGGTETGFEMDFDETESIPGTNKIGSKTPTQHEKIYPVQVEQGDVNHPGKKERAVFRSPNPNHVGKQISKDRTPIDVATPAKARQQFLDDILSVSQDGGREVSNRSDSSLSRFMKDAVELYSPASTTNFATSPMPEEPKSEKDNRALVVVVPEEQQGNDGLYKNRIDELEQNLNEQRINTDEVQDRLRTRVLELEQALRVTAATPRGTIIQQNPLTTLLDRNQTLVKEVRFADQTCVELSSKNSKLEEQIKQLQEKVATLEVENGDLRIMNSERALKDADTIKHLKNQMEGTQTLQSNADAVVSVIKDAFKSWNGAQVQNIPGDNGNDDDGLAALSTASDIESEAGKTLENSSSMGVGTSSKKLCGFDQQIHAVVHEFLTQKQAQFGQENKKSDDGSDDLDDHSKSRIENEFLGRQLGQTQTKLDEVEMLLRTERARSDTLEVQLKRGAETYVRLIEPLEKRLLEVTQAASSIPGGLVNADVRLFGLQKELAHAKASLTAIKRESERLLDEKNLTVDLVTNVKANEEVITVIQTAFMRMGQQYKQLESDVSNIVHDLGSRMEAMTETITFLRSSFLFDKNDVADGLRGGGQRPTPHSASKVREDLAHDESDELLELMEEARSPRKLEIDFSADLDDITLESLVKSVSVLSPISHADRFKEPLEAAIRECQRVRERSSKLKEQIETQMTTISQLEEVNRRLVLTLEEQQEECNLLKKASNFSSQQMAALEAALKTAEVEREQSLQLHQKEMDALQHDNAQIRTEASRLREQEATLSKLLQDSETKISRLKSDLRLMTESHDDLVAKMTTSEKESSERKDAELEEAAMALQRAETDLSKLRKSNHDLLQLRSQNKDEISSLTSTVKELESKQRSLQSDLEDQGLEMQVLKEDIRKERAEFKSELSQKEGENSSIRSSLASTKAKYLAELNEKDAVAEKILVLSKIRVDVWSKLQTHGVCTELSSIKSSIDSTGSNASIMKEIELHISGLPYICAQVEESQRELHRLSSVENEANAYSSQLETTEARENELRSQNDELFALLQQADGRVEDSLSQIKAMQETLDEIQEQKQEAVEKAEVMEVELDSLRNEARQNVSNVSASLSKSKEELKNVMEELESSCAALKRVTDERDAALSDLGRLSTQLTLQQNEEASLQATNQSLTQKCSRLREYIKKLTGKCSEWESSYDRQARAIERLQDKNRRITIRYKELVEQKREQKLAHQQHRSKWSEERSNLHQVHMNLEHELEEIAQQLALPVEIEPST